MTADIWQFWIDVGGTFTDCLARNESTGELSRCKVLSSAVVRGSFLPEASTDAEIVDAGRIGEPQDFWKGYSLRLLAADGSVVQATSVTGFAGALGRLQLADDCGGSCSIATGYELVSPEAAPLLAVRRVLGLRLDQPIPPVRMRLGTTRGTNALLTRTGARTGLVTTTGFGDFLHIGNQDRPKLFELAIHKNQPLFEHVVEVSERIATDGTVLTSLDEEHARAQLQQLKDAGAQSLAICLLNAYCQDQHERALASLANEIGFAEVCISSEVAPVIKLVSRGATTVVDAYLNPVLRSYVRSIADKLNEAGSLRLMTSAGGLVSAERFSGKDSILSGPAGGVVGFARAAEAAGFAKAIGFDMGGTSTDVSRYDGKFELEYETVKAGVRIVAPTLAIETVAAGGGSICQFDGVKLRVGPESAGADPGPACYGLGGPITVTDVNLFLGKLPVEQFPIPLNLGIVQSKLATIRDTVAEATGRHYELAELAEGFLAIANQNMSAAIRSISVAKGYDAAEYLLVAFGGAAGSHACAVADLLGMTQILSHPDAGILSAYGIGLADVVRHQSRGVYQLCAKDSLAQCKAILAELEQVAVGEVMAEGVAQPDIIANHSLDLRYQGTDSFLTIPWNADGKGDEDQQHPRAAFETLHQRLYGYTHQSKPLEIVSVRVEAVGRSSHASLEQSDRVKSRGVQSKEHTDIVFSGRTWQASVFDRSELQPGDTFDGPAMLMVATATTIVDPGWRAEVLSGGEIVIGKRKAESGKRKEPAANLRRGEGASRPAANGSPETSPADQQPDPILLEIFNNQFAAIAEQMGITLKNTASSVNVKERLDFSCALFTAKGNLVVNAPHIPVHLGAMSETVKWVLADNPDMQPGDVIVTNDPYRGGSHLPDVTVVTPVFADASSQTAAGELSELLFFTASRAHHAEIGGITPGSMPPFSKSLAEEGVLIRNFKVVRGGQSQMESLKELLQSGKYPSRSPADNLADLEAQIAANHQGGQQLHEMIAKYTQPQVLAYMQHIQAAAEHKTRQSLAALSPGKRSFTDYLDDGSPITVTIDIRDRLVASPQPQAVLDFTGTGPVLAGNLNANRGIVSAAVLYCLRCLIDEDIPLNEGVLQAVEIILPQCLLNPPADDDPAKCAAVVGGNVETSQRVVDVVLAALDLAAASQGTMNNVLFGNPSFGFYETICGGSGATATAAGASAVHTHMTNTRITDPEVMEQRYPVRVSEFKIRSGSGGKGEHAGGDGVIRTLEFLAPLQLSIVSQRRGDHPPFGLHGGEAGALGENSIVRADGTTEQLGGLVSAQVQPGDKLTIQTPGGGGWGKYS